MPALGLSQGSKRILPASDHSHPAAPKLPKHHHHDEQRDMQPAVECFPHWVCPFLHAMHTSQPGETIHLWRTRSQQDRCPATAGEKETAPKERGPQAASSDEGCDEGRHEGFSRYPDTPNRTGDDHGPLRMWSTRMFHCRCNLMR